MAESVGVRVLSKAVFGNQHRLEVLAAIAQTDGRFYQRELAEATGIPDATVSPILRRLEEAGLIRAIERLSLNGPQFYERQPHRLWAIAQELFGTESPFGSARFPD
jgi:transcription initiation factor IIE alpha subunit